MSVPNPRPVRRQRLTLIGLALLFIAPLGLAFYAYYGLHWHPGRRVNHGELIDPPRPIPTLSLPRVVEAAGPTGEGGVPGGADVFKGSGRCFTWGPGCAPRPAGLSFTTRARCVPLCDENDRVQRVFVAEGDCCDMEFLRTQHPDLITVRATPEAAPLFALLERGSGDDAGAVRPGVADAGHPGAADRIYLVDPLGNLMMWYPPGAPPKGMLEDLKRLLGLSHVG